MTSRSRSEGFGFIGMLLLLMLVSLGATTVFLMTEPPAATRAAGLTATRGSVLRAAIGQFRFNHGGSSGTYPTSLAYLVATDGTTCALNNTPSTTTYLTLQGWCGPYVDQLYLQDLNSYQTDGWGTLFYFNSTTGALKSCGPDRVCGDGDDIAF